MPEPFIPRRLIETVHSDRRSARPAMAAHGPADRAAPSGPAAGHASHRVLKPGAHAHDQHGPVSATGFHALPGRGGYRLRRAGFAASGGRRDLSPPHRLRARPCPRCDTAAFDRHVLAAILAVSASEGGPVASRCGLAAHEISDLLHRFFPAVGDLGARWQAHAAPLDEESAMVRDLLLAQRSADPQVGGWLAAMLARRAMEPNHLWEDLGLRARDELTRLMNRISRRSPAATPATCAGSASSTEACARTTASSCAQRPFVPNAAILPSASATRAGEPHGGTPAQHRPRRPRFLTDTDTDGCHARSRLSRTGRPQHGAAAPWSGAG